MQHSTWKILILLFFFVRCDSGKSPERPLRVQVPQTSMRAEPNERSREITLLQKDHPLTDLGEVGPSESQIMLGNDLIQTPWIKVQTENNQTGWVPGWALDPSEDKEAWLLNKRLDCYFGKGLRSRRDALIEQFSSAETEQQLSLAWQEATQLRDTFLWQLSSRPEIGFQPDFRWLNEVLPGFIYQIITDGERPYLFADFRTWKQKALKTNGLQDDVYFQIGLNAFPIDSIESFFPVWKFQLSESESVSQLGTSQHLKLLQQISQAIPQAELFTRPLLALKDQVMEDIFDKSQRYWQPKEKILSELTVLLANPPECLSATERDALGIRKKMFEDPAANGIVANMRSGVIE